MKISNSLQSVLLSTIALGLQASGHAQGNLVNLYGWTPDTLHGYSPNSGISITSFNSADFYGQHSTNLPNSGPDHIIPILTGILETTPGATYEISYTIVESEYFQVSFSESFGNASNLWNLGNIGVRISSQFPDARGPVNFTYTAVATSPTTTMTFTGIGIDNGNAVMLSNLSVIEAPEISAARLFGFGGCVLLFAQQWRRLFQKWKRN